MFWFSFQLRRNPHLRLNTTFILLGCFGLVGCPERPLWRKPLCTRSLPAAQQKGSFQTKYRFNRFEGSCCLEKDYFWPYVAKDVPISFAIQVIIDLRSWNKFFMAFRMRDVLVMPSEFFFPLTADCTFTIFELKSSTLASPLNWSCASVELFYNWIRYGILFAYFL